MTLHADRLKLAFRLRPRRRTSLLVILTLFASAAVISLAPAAQAECFIPGNCYYVDADLTVTRWDPKSHRISLFWSNDPVAEYDIAKTFVNMALEVDSEGVLDTRDSTKEDQIGFFDGLERSSIDDEQVDTSVNWDNGFYVQVSWSCGSHYGKHCPGDEEDTNYIVYSEAVFVSGSTEPSPTPTSSPTDTRPAFSLGVPTHGGAVWEAGAGIQGDDYVIRYPVSVSNVGDEEARVNYEFIPGIQTVSGSKVEQAEPGVDYEPTGPRSGTLTFVPGGESTQSIDVVVYDDQDIEFDQIFALRISVNPDNGIIEGPDTVRGLILDNDREGASSMAAVTNGTVLVNGEEPDEYERIGPGTTIEVDAGTATILFSDNETSIVLNNGTIWKFVTPTLSKLVRGAARFKLLPGNWTVQGRNATTRVKGTTFTVETSKRSDRIRTYAGSVKATGKKGKAVTVKKDFQTVCPAKKACTKPTKFKSPSNPFWDA